MGPSSPGEGGIDRAHPGHCPGPGGGRHEQFVVILPQLEGSTYARAGPAVRCSHPTGDPQPLGRPSLYLSPAPRKIFLIHCILQNVYAEMQIFLFVLYSGNTHNWFFPSISSEAIGLLNEIIPSNVIGP